MKRQRGRGRKPGNSANRSYESNGPEVKIRGNASQIYDKYLQLARDSSSAGDRVRAENLYQHAEHYYRIVQANTPKREPGQDEGADNADASGDNAEGEQQGGQDRPQNRNQDRDRDRGRGRGRGRGRDRDRSEQNDQMSAEAPEGQADGGPSGDGETEAAQPPAADGEDENAPRRRSRRPRRPRAESDASSPAENSSAQEALETASASADQVGPEDSDTAAA
jgi:hypothetical protein